VYVPIEEVCARGLSMVCVEVGIESGCGSKSHDPIESGEERDIAHRVRGARRPSPCRSCYPTKREPSSRTPSPPFRATLPSLTLPALSSSSSSESPLEGEGSAGGGDGPPVRASALPTARAPSVPAPAATVDAGGGGGVRGQIESQLREWVGE
jgi:hypothetical protein